MTQVQTPIADMALRDWFAGKALVALDYWSTRDKFPLLKDGLTYEQLIAHHAYAMADALLAERAVKGGACSGELARDTIGTQPEGGRRPGGIHLDGVHSAGVTDASGAVSKRNAGDLAAMPL
jgi:hypothetical protein